MPIVRLPCERIGVESLRSRERVEGGTTPIANRGCRLEFLLDCEFSDGKPRPRLLQYFGLAT